MTTLWPRINAVLLMLVLGALVTTIAMLARGASGGPLDPEGTPGPTDSVRLPGTPISSVPFAITAPGRYYLTRSLGYTGSGSAISIAEHVDDVTLDLGGFTLTGPFGGSGIRALGPTTPSQFPLQIVNGYVRHFQTGVNVELAAHVRIDGVHAFNNTGNGFNLGHHSVVSNCTAANNGGHGIYVASSLVHVENCMVIDNGQSGVYVAGDDSSMRNLQVLRNGATGVIFAGSGNLIEESVVKEHSGDDIRIAGLGNTVRDNTTRFMQIESTGATTYIMDNVCVGGNGRIFDASAFIDFIPVVTAPHANYECPVQVP